MTKLVREGRDSGDILGLIVALVFVASNVFGATAQVQYDTLTHAVKKPTVSAGAVYDLDFTGLSLGGISGGGTPGGSTTQLQYNNAGAFGGITGATTNGTILTLASPAITTPTGLVRGDVGLGTGVDFAAIAQQTITAFDTNNNITDSLLRLRHNTSGTAQNGMGSSLGFDIQNAAGTQNVSAGALSVLWTNATGGSEASDMIFTLSNSGSATPKMRLFASGGLGVNNQTDPGAGWVNANTGFKISGTQVAASDLGNGVTGSGNIVLKTSPTLVTPLLGTPTSGTLTNCTGLPPTTGIVGWPANASGALTNNGSGTLSWVPAGGTGTVTSITATSPIVFTPNPITTTGTATLDVSVDHAFTAAQGITVDDAVNNAVTNLLTLSHTTSGTAAAGIGSRIKFRAENASAAATDVAFIDGVLSNATGSLEASYLDFGTRIGGGSFTSKMRLFGSGGLSVNSTTDPGGGIVNAATGYRIANAAASRTVLVGNGTNFVPSTETYAVPGTDGNVMTASSGNWTSAAIPGVWDGAVNITGSNFTTTNLTATDVFVTSALVAGATYEFEVVINFLSSDASGVKFAIHSVGTGTAPIITSNGFSGGTNIAFFAVDTLSVATGTGGTRGAYFLKGLFVAAGTGPCTMSFQIAKVTAGTATVYIGSTLKWRKTS